MSVHRAEATHCPSGHELPADASFCPECGAPVEHRVSPAVDHHAGPSSPSVVLRFPDHPPSWLVGHHRFRVLWVVLALLGAEIVIEVVRSYVIFSRPLYYVVDIALVAFAASRLREVHGRALAGLYAAEIGTLLLGLWVIGPLVDKSLGYSGKLGSINPWSLIGTAGAVSAGVLICAYFDPEVRSGLDRMARPHPPTFDAIRAAGLVALAALTLVAIGRMLTGWYGFHLVPTQQAAATSYFHRHCTASVDANFPEFNVGERARAIRFCDDTGRLPGASGATSNSGGSNSSGGGTSGQSGQQTEVTVPDVTGMSFGQAIQALQQAGLQVSPTTAGQTNDIVTGQDPTAGSTASQGASVRLSLNGG